MRLDVDTETGEVVVRNHIRTFRTHVDDVVAIELKAVAGATLPLVDPDYEPDGAAALLEDGTTVDTDGDPRPELLDQFPFMPLPGGGFQTVPGTSSPS